MQFNGGKGSCAKELSTLIHALRPRSYWEPFVGAANVIQHVQAERKIGSDVDASLISLLIAVREGWIPPAHVSESVYLSGKTLSDFDPLKAFLKYGCSFGGKPWGGFARSGQRNYALNAHNSLLKKAKKLSSVSLVTGDYREVGETLSVDLIYCDPPYANTTAVGGGGAFDSRAFFSWVRQRKEIVLVSERTAPDDFVCIWEKRLTDGLGARKLTERLFVRADQVYEQFLLALCQHA